MEPSPPTNPSFSRDSWGLALTIMGLGLILLLALAGPAAQWLVWDTAVITGLPLPAWFFLTAGGLENGFLLFLAGLLGWRWRRSARYRAVFQTWAAAALFALVLLPLRGIPPATYSDAAGLAVLGQIGGALLFLLALRLLARLLGQRWQPARFTPLWPAALLAPLLLAGWLAPGSFGSWDDLLLQVLAGLLFGRAAGRLLAQFLLPHLFNNEDGKPGGRSLLFGAIVAGSVLLIIGPAFALFGQTLLFLAVLPPLGWPLLAVLFMDQPTPEPADAWPAAAWLLGLVTAGLMALFDADELNMIILVEPGELFSRLLVPGGVTILLAVALGLAGFLLRERLGRPAGAALAAVLWVGLAAGYFLAGQPGFYGDRTFVVLESQADLSGAAAIPDVDERRAFVYDTLVNEAKTSQGEMRAALERFGIDYRPYYLVNALEVGGGWPVRLWLSTRPEVARIMPSYTMRPLPEPREPAEGSASRPEAVPWNLTLIGAERVWEEFGVRGAGVTIGQSDSGVELTHPELVDSYRGSVSGHDYNWFDPWYNTPFPVDTNGHGTHTLGSVLGNTVGVAPDADWFACANLQRPLGNPALYLDCLQFMLAPWPLDGDPLLDGRSDLAADVLNNSWACPPIEGCDPLSLQPAVSALRAAGIFVVVSAGNSGFGGCETVTDPPAIYDEVFAIGAVNYQKHLADFSSRGPVTLDGETLVKPDISAPGVDVLSAYPQGTYEFASGTSMAGPHVAGVVALMWSANPALIGQIDQTERLLITTAKPLDPFRLAPDACGPSGATPNNLTGYGLVDAYTAVQAALQLEE